MTTASCDCCGKMRFNRPVGDVCGIETSACWECRNDAPECDVCGEELEDGKCLWCFGNKHVGEIRSLLQKMRRENEGHLLTLKQLRDAVESK